MSKRENIKHFAARSFAVWLDMATDRRRSFGQRRFVSNKKKARNIVILSSTHIYPHITSCRHIRQDKIGL